MMFCGCNSRSTSSVIVERQFPLPTVPALYSSGEQARYYIAEHYWDILFGSKYIYSVGDTTKVAGMSANVFESAFVNYVALLNTLPIENSILQQRRLFERAEQKEILNREDNIFEAVVELSEKYLYGPNSPYRCEDLYTPIVEGLAVSKCATDTQTIEAKNLLPKISLNRIGTKANDFEFTLRKGTKKSLYGVKSDYIIVLFSNPGCSNCLDFIEAIKSIPNIDQLISSNRLAVVNVFPDADINEWFGYSSIYPKNWLNGFDHNQILNRDSIYNLRAIPSLYLLDSEKIVILKDATIESLMAELRNRIVS